MSAVYERYRDDEITKELLDGIAVGDLITIADWKRPLRVNGVSENYFVMSTNAFGKTIYSVCEKKRWGGTMHNAMRGGKFHCGRDNQIFGWYGGYEFWNKETAQRCLAEFESGALELSQRNAIPIYQIRIKRGNK